MKQSEFPYIETFDAVSDETEIRVSQGQESSRFHSLFMLVLFADSVLNLFIVSGFLWSMSHEISFNFALTGYLFTIVLFFGYAFHTRSSNTAEPSNVLRVSSIVLCVLGSMMTFWCLEILDEKGGFIYSGILLPLCILWWLLFWQYFQKRYLAFKHK